MNQPNVNQPNVNQPNVNQPNVNQPNVNQPNVNQPNVNQPDEKVNLRSKSQEMGSQPSEAEEQDWWTAENELRPKQPKSRIFKGTYLEGPEKPKKRGKAHNRRGQNDHAD